MLILASCNPLGTNEEAPESFGLEAEFNGGELDTTETHIVDQVDDDNSSTGFGGGAFRGVIYSNGVVTLNTTTNTSELNESWTPRWNNLVAYWKMDEASWDGSIGEVIDSKGAHHGTRVGNATTTSSAKIGDHAGIFDGNGDYINLNDDLVFNTAKGLSISSWLYNGGSYSGTSTYQAIIQLKTNLGGGYIIALSPTYNGVITSGSKTQGFRSFKPSTDISALLLETWNHLVLTYDGVDRGQLSSYKLYLNGLEVDLVNQTLNANVPNQNAIGQWTESPHAGNYRGSIDDLAVWDAKLTADEVALIYSRQSAKYAGEIQSRIMDSHSINSSWTNLNWITTLPLGKELPDGGGAFHSESTADYEDLYSDSLMSDLVALWHLNESNGASSVIDDSYNGRNGTPVDVTFGEQGKFKNSALFNGSSSGIVTNSFSVGNSLSVSAWVKVNSIAGGEQTIIEHSRETDQWFGLWKKDGADLFQFRWARTGTCTIDFVTTIRTNKWYHLVGTYDATSNTASVYLNGKLENTATGGTTPTPVSGIATLGRNGSGSEFFSGNIDEVAIWNRALHTEEILQLYLRGANQIKYQVRACTNADCSDQDAFIGDGWKGPGGNYLTYFSELYNNSTVASSCEIAQECFSSEISLDGDVQTSSPSIYFNQFGTDGVSVDNNRYFQYRVIMESDDENTACNSGTQTCLPKLKSVEIGPTHTYQQ